MSNPCNPTGKLVQGDELARWVATARELDCTLLSMSSIRTTSGPESPDSCRLESAARYVEDVKQRPGGDLRRTHQELALSRLASDLTVGLRESSKAVASAARS